MGHISPIIFPGPQQVPLATLTHTPPRLKIGTRNSIQSRAAIIELEDPIFDIGIYFFRLPLGQSVMITRFTRSVPVIHYYFRGAKFVSHELIHFCQGLVFSKKFFVLGIDQNADYLLNKIMTYLFYGIKKEKREREEIHFHTQKNIIGKCKEKI